MAPWTPPDADAVTPPPYDSSSTFPIAGGDDERRRILTLTVAIVAVLALFGGMVAFLVDDRGGDDLVAPTPTTGPSSPGTVEPIPTPTTAPPATEEELLAVVAELQAFVEAAREKEFLTDVEVELVEDNEFIDLLLEDFDDGVDDLQRTEVTLRALGLLSPEQSLALELRSVLGAGVLGFYDTEVNRLVVRGGSLTPYVRQTIVHELVHALDDQHFELFRPALEDRKDEIGLGLSSVVEGTATVVEDAWEAQLSDEEREQLLAEEAAFGAGIDVTRFPEILLLLVGAPYSIGPILVREIIAQRGQRGVDAALQSPPDTSEQVLFPDRYFSVDPRIEVPVPPVPGGVEVVDDGVVGAYFWLSLFSLSTSSVNSTDAIRGIEGWGGDWYVSYQADGNDCIRADVVGDTEADTDEFRIALERWAEDAPNASVSEVDGRVRLDACNPSAAAGNSNL